MTSNLDVPHPLLKRPELYIADPRAQVSLKWTGLQEVFSSCGKVSSGGRHAEGSRRWWLVIFEDLFHGRFNSVTLGTRLTMHAQLKWPSLRSKALLFLA